VKGTIVIGFIVLMTSFILKDALVYGVFKIQQDYLSKNVCVEREMSESHCKGGCVLTDRLEKADTTTSKNESEPIVQEVKIELFFTDEIEAVNVVTSTSHIFNCLIEDEFRGFLLNQIIPPEIV
jgi:hypothetical protein